MNFIKLFEDYNVPNFSDKNGEWINIDCPYCDEEKGHYNLGFNCGGNYYHCWKSIHSYPLTKVLSDVLSISQSEVKSILSEYEGGATIVKKEKFSKVKYLELPTDTFTSVERKYLKSRNFDPKYLYKKYNIVGGGIDGPWKFRIIIPVYYQGKLMSWTGRSILSKKKLKELGIPRYKNLSIEKSVKNIKELFFNIDNCKSDTVVLTEGAFDVLRFDGNAICSMGTELTEGQINLLANRFRKIFILFDNEPEAQEKARKFGLQLSSIGVDVEIVNAYEDFGKNDMGECSKKEIEMIKNELKID
jgi:hypothetical protein